MIKTKSIKAPFAIPAALLQAVCLCAVLIGHAQAVVPHRYFKEQLPEDATINTLSRRIQSHGDAGRLAHLYRTRGVHYTELYRYQQAVDDFSRALEKNNKYLAAYLNRAHAYAKLEKYKEAYADFAAAQKLEPDNKFIYKLRGPLSFLLGRFEQAAADFKRYLQLDNKDMYRMLWLHLAQKYMDSKKTSDIMHYAAGLDLDVWPGALVRLYAGQINDDDFLKAFAKEIAIWDPGHICEGFFYLGQYYLLQGDRAKASRVFSQAMKTKARQFVEYEFATAYYYSLNKSTRPEQARSTPAKPENASGTAAATP